MRDLVSVKNNLGVKIDRFFSSSLIISFLLKLIYVFFRRDFRDDFFIDFFLRNLAEDIEEKSGYYFIILY